MISMNKGMVFQAQVTSAQTVAIKLAMPGIWDWWHQFPPLLGYNSL